MFFRKLESKPLKEDQFGHGTGFFGSPLFNLIYTYFLYTTLSDIWFSIQNTIRKKSAIYTLMQDDSHLNLPTPTPWEEHLLFVQVG